MFLCPLGGTFLSLNEWIDRVLCNEKFSHRPSRLIFSLDLQSTPYPYVFIPSLKDWIFPLIRNGSYVLSYVLWQCPEYVSSLISNCKLETRCIYLATRFSVIQRRKPTDYRNPLLFKWIREVPVCLEMYISGIIPLVLPVYIWHSLTIPGICWILLLKVRKYLYVCCIGMYITMYM